MPRERIFIQERLSYFPPSEEPLSANTGVYEGRACTWIFGPGCGPRAAENILGLPGEKRVVLSHFHRDHMANWDKVPWTHLYQGRHTFRYTGSGEVVQGSCTPEEGVRLIEIPSSHAKGCIGMEVEERYAFLGDAVYSGTREGRIAYNANLLADEMKVLRELKAEYFLLSHSEPFLRTKEDVLAELEAVYARRDTQSTYIFL